MDIAGIGKRSSSVTLLEALWKLIAAVLCIYAFYWRHRKLRNGFRRNKISQQNLSGSVSRRNIKIGDLLRLLAFVDALSIASLLQIGFLFVFEFEPLLLVFYLPVQVESCTACLSARPRAGIREIFSSILYTDPLF